MTALDPRITTALVTGSARRNGRAMALWLAQQGVRVAVHYLSSEAEAEQTRAQCDALCKGATKLQGDLTDPTQAAQVVEQGARQLGSLHVLVNNVGNYLRKDLFELTPQEWRDQIESNLYTAWFCVHAAVPIMRAHGFGRVVNMGYAAGERPTYNRLTVPYHIAKTGLATLTRSAAAAVAKQGLTVNTIGVGILENSIIKPVNPPAGRFAGFEDICNALGFFLSPQSDHINGSQLDINGGWIPEQIL